MKNVVCLSHREGVRLDVARLSALVARLGEAAAEDHLSRAVEEMALRLAHVEQGYLDGDAAIIGRHTARLAELAATLGMASFARVAADVRACAHSGDMVAFAATWARLRRIGERSLDAVWDIGAPGA